MIPSLKNIPLFFVTLGCVALLGSCSQPEAKPPAQLIPEEKFVDLLTDVRLLEASYGVRVGRPDTVGKYMDTYYKMLFDKHGVVKEQFTQSYAYYLADHERMLLMEDKVLEKLTILQAENDKKIPLEIRNLKDSTGVSPVVDSLIEKTKPSAQSPSKPE